MNQDYQDKDLVCAICESEFVWTSGEQSFINDLKDKGKIQFVVQPKRCHECRQKRRQEKSKEEFGGNFNSDFNSGYPA